MRYIETSAAVHNY